MTILKTILSLILSLAVMTGGQFGTLAFTAPEQPPQRAERRFEELAYQRPDLAVLTAAAEEAAALVASGADASKAAESLDSFFTLYYSYYSMSNIARIRSFSDVNDTYYAAEYAWCVENGAEAERLLESVYLACGSSADPKDFEKQYFGEGFLADYGGNTRERYTSEVLALRRVEAELVNAYYELTAAPTLTISGEEFALDDCYAAAGEDRYGEVLMEYYRQVNSRIADIYISLVKVRSALAKEMGCESVWDMYAEQYGRDFSRDEAAALLDGIAEKIAPLYRESLFSGEAEPLTAEESTLRSLLETAANAMGGKTREAFEYMRSYAMCDLTARPEKAAESFTVYLYDANAPFSFVSPVGSAADVFTTFHEFGHFTQMFADYNAERSLDLAECFSQGMELLALKSCAASLAPESFHALAELKYKDLLSVYTQQGVCARFEEAVYSVEPEELSAELLNAISLACAKEFGMTDYLSEEYCSYFWMDIEHFILYPYYVLSYCVSADAALQMFAMECEQEGAGRAVFDALLEQGESSLLPALEKAGLQSPFSAGRRSTSAEELQRFTSFNAGP